ncbi:MAG: hypothetical protein J7K63_06475 [Candidatus Marinimicrobia bacterium]|nr:hypothetical protein [Candidatus Neomarinimicrobiota bacterium]
MEYENKDAMELFPGESRTTVNEVNRQAGHPSDLPLKMLNTFTKTGGVTCRHLILTGSFK